jgi:hypothetical protein
VSSEQRRSAETDLKASWAGLVPSIYGVERRNRYWVSTKKPGSLFAQNGGMLEASLRRRSVDSRDEPGHDERGRGIP